MLRLCSLPSRPLVKWGKHHCARKMAMLRAFTSFPRFIIVSFLKPVSESLIAGGS
jgi:hypothetical protein